MIHNFFYEFIGDVLKYLLIIFSVPLKTLVYYQLTFTFQIENFRKTNSLYYDDIFLKAPHVDRIAICETLRLFNTGADVVMKIKINNNNIKCIIPDIVVEVT